MPEIRVEYIDVYPFRRGPRGVEFLLLKRRPDTRIGGTWHAVHGKIEAGETAVAAALRELAEETGLRPTAFWQVDTPHVFFMSAFDRVVVAPCFAAEIDPAAEVRLNAEHTAQRWVAADAVVGELMWPGQRQTVQQIMEYILRPSAAEPFLRIPLA